MSEYIDSTYELLYQIGSGGGGTVYLANHTRLNKKVVLKCDKRKISADITSNKDILRREVDVLKNLNHTYIPQVYDFFIEDENVYTVMDYIEGQSLDRPLKEGKTFSQPQVIEWVRQLLEALCYMHSPTHGDPPHGIVHSDIKPANIMLTPRGDICLIDFNIALAIGEKSVIGRSEGYASPEHYGLDFSFSNNYTENRVTEITGTETEIMPDNEETEPMYSNSSKASSGYTQSKRIVIPDTRSDIYSLGATLYHLLTGKKPARSALEVIPISKKKFSPQIVDIITKAMNPNPDLRYQSAEEMLYAFEHLWDNDIRIKRLKHLSIAVYLIFTLVFAVGTSSAFVGLKRMEAANNSLTLAEYSQNALAAGNIEEAVKYALDALPEQKNILIPAYTSPAQKALADALNVYDVSDGFKEHRTVSIPSETLKVVLSDDGKICAAVYAFEVILFDTQSGNTIISLPCVESALADVVFADNETIIYAGRSGISAYNFVHKEELWVGDMATSIAISSDGQTIAAVYRDSENAVIYNINGDKKMDVYFEGKGQKVIENDIFADPEDNLFELSADGKYLALSFSDGGLMVFDTSDSEGNAEIYDVSDYTHFEGGFSGNYFAFSSTNSNESVFAVIDMQAMAQTGGFQSESQFGVQADSSGIYLSNKDVAVKIHPVTGEQQEIAYTEAGIRSFITDTEHTIVIAKNNKYMIFDKNAKLTDEFDAGEHSCDFVDISGDFVVEGGRDTPRIRVLEQKVYDSSDLIRYDPNYIHNEARICDNTVMLFNYKGFRLYNKDGSLICENEIPDAEYVYDQQYSRKSGNLAVMYKDALRIYSGNTGEILFEETDLKSVFYAPYGISILEQDGVVKLINADTAAADAVENSFGNYAAYCGAVINDELLNGAELIGASKINDDYFFAVGKNNICELYNGIGNKLFEMPVSDNTEVFFVQNHLILSPLHGTPVVYDLKTGTRTADLDKDSYLTYITETDEYIVSQYISADGFEYGKLLDKNTFETLAYLPDLSDIFGNELIFDYYTGVLRKTSIYSIDELIDLAKRGEY